MCIFERSLAVDKSDQLMREEAFHSTSELSHHSVFALTHSREIKSIREISHSENRSFTKCIQYLRILAESLRRNTTLIQARTSYMPSLDQNDLDSPFCCQQGGLITARTGTDNYNLHMNIL